MIFPTNHHPAQPRRRNLHRPASKQNLPSVVPSGTQAKTTTTTTIKKVRTGSLLFLVPQSTGMATTITTTLTISTSTAALPSPSPPPAKGALRRPTTTTTTTTAIPSSPASSTATAATKKSASFSPDLARDLQTGEIVPPQTMTGAEYRAWFRERRKTEQRRRSLREQVERDYDVAMKRLVFAVAEPY